MIEQNTKWDIRSFEGCGTLKFGMSQEEVTQQCGTSDRIFMPKIWVDKTSKAPPSPQEISQVRDNSAWHCCTFIDGKLALLEGDFESLNTLSFKDYTFNEMNRLEAALYLTKHSKTYGQAQGGSLYFEDLGIAILQFETVNREIIIWDKKYIQNEPLRPIMPNDIVAYFTQQSGQIIDI